jgi:hypothetical protein
MTSKRPHRTDRRRTQADLEAMRQVAHQAIDEFADEEELELDPASELFFQYAAPLLLTARSEQEFAIASELAEFVWAATHFDAQTQVTLLADFIAQTNVPDHLVPWLLEIYQELAARKELLVG